MSSPQGLCNVQILHRPVKKTKSFPSHSVNKTSAREQENVKVRGRIKNEAVSAAFRSLQLLLFSSLAFSGAGCSCGAGSRRPFSPPRSASPVACGSGLGVKGASVCGAVVCVQLMGARTMAGWRGQKARV